MRLFLFLLIISMNMAHAEIGRVLKVDGKDAYVMRSSLKHPLSKGMPLELGDELVSEKSVIVIHVYPGTQLSLAKKSHIRLSEQSITKQKNEEKAYSLVEFKKGMIRLQVNKAPNQEIEQVVKGDGVSFTANKAEYEISYAGKNVVDLDVIDGEVTVSSPYVHTFVPEIVKAREGFRFDKNKKAFSRRKFSLKWNQGL